MHRPTAPLGGPAAPATGDLRAAAAREIVAIEAALASEGRTVLDLLSGVFAPGEHYPDGEVWDIVSHAQYFYHGHPGGGREPGEHGHFHTFLGQAGVRRGVIPFVLPEMALAPVAASSGRGDIGTHRSPRDRGIFSHLVGVTVDGHGRPIGLFTTNRWVTGETWYRAEDVIGMLASFEFTAPETDTPANRWLASVLRLLRPHIVELVLERDAAVMDWRRRRSRQHHVFDDRRLENTSSRRIDFAAELAAALVGNR